MWEANKLPSQFQIDDKVFVFSLPGKVERVTFSGSKVTYDVALEEGGETVRNVDSAFVEKP